MTSEKRANSIDEKIERAKQRLEQLKADKRKSEMRQRQAESKKKRAEDTRRKILLGAYVISKMEANEESKRKVLAELNDYLTNDADRKLFDL